MAGSQQASNLIAIWIIVVLASLGAAWAEESPFKDRLSKIKQAEEKSLADLADKVRAYASEADKRQARQLKARLIRQHAISQGFDCGRTFISVPSADSFVWTLRKADVQNLLWYKGSAHFIVIVKREGKEPFNVKISPAFRQLVKECLD